MQTSPRPNTISSLSCYLLAVLVALVPFHAILTVWLASNFGHYTWFRLWVEVIMGILFAKVLYLVIREKVALKSSGARALWWLSVAYGLLHVVLGLVALGRHAVNSTALADGLVLNLRPIVMFWLAVVIANRNEWLRAHWRQLVLYPAAIVIVFGLLQHFVLPADFLRHLGYGPKTIMPFDTVNQNAAYVRVQSTFRGANPLGAYLVIIVAALTSLFIYAKKQRSKLLLSISLVATCVVLFFTYSRSAWLGTALAVGGAAWLAIKKSKARRIFVIAALALVVVASLGIAGLRHNSQFDDTFLHTDKVAKVSTSSNQGHVSALKNGLHDVVHNPLGRGPGTAGPASAHNNHAARLAENYFIQLGQEVGILGAGIFIAINILIGEMLWKRKDPLSYALLASLLGITLINMFSHAWTDDSLAVVWWALAGIALADGIIKNKQKHEKVTKKAKVPTRSGR